MNVNLNMWKRKINLLVPLTITTFVGQLRFNVKQ